LCVIVAATIIIPFVKQYVISNINGWKVGFLEYTYHYLLGWGFPIFCVALLVLLVRVGAFRFLSNRMALDLPFVAAYTRRIALSRFLWTLSVLVDSTVPLHEAVARAARATGNRRLERDIVPAIPKILQGETLSESFSQSRYLSVMMKQMIDIGETSGKLPETLGKAAEYAINDAQFLARIVISLVEVLLIVWIGVWIVMTQ